MAPLTRLFALFALSTAVLASPHVARNVYNHAHRAVVVPDAHVDARAALPLPRRQRSLNKRCVPRPTTNSTTSAVPTSTVVPISTVVPTSSAPINVAPLPSLPTSSPSAAETSSAYSPPSSQAPSPTTSASPSSTIQAPSPSPTTTTPSPPPATSSTTSSTPPPAQTSSSSSSTSTSGLPSYLTGTLSGQGTWYATGLGACGWTNNDGQNIVAVSESLFDTFPGYDGVNPNTNPVCGRQITASYQGKSVSATIVDRCTGCSTLDLDFSPNAFDTLALASVGRIGITWSFT